MFKFLTNEEIGQINHCWIDNTTYLKKRVLVQDQGRGKITTTGILKYSEDLNFASTKILGQKTFLRWVVVKSNINPLEVEGTHAISYRAFSAHHFILILFTVVSMPVFPGQHIKFRISALK